MFPIALADFPNYDGLSKMRRTTFTRSDRHQGSPCRAPQGPVAREHLPGSLGMSNVDLAEEFVEIAEHAYQANSRM